MVLFPRRGRWGSGLGFRGVRAAGAILTPKRHVAIVSTLHNFSLVNVYLVRSVRRFKTVKAVASRTIFP